MGSPHLKRGSRMGINNPPGPPSVRDAPGSALLSNPGLRKNKRSRREVDINRSLSRRKMVVGERTTHHILMWIQVHFESVGFTPLQNSYSVVHKVVVVFSTRHDLRHVHERCRGRGTHGPACSSASHVRGNRRKLKPQPLSLVRCTSAEPSSRFSGCPMKLSSPASALSQKSSRIYEGRSTGAFDDPERLTPRKRRVRPALSTKLHAVVWMKESPVGFPVVGEDEGTLGIL